jgi:RNA polymerase sigma factor (sigma-70 family)
MRIPRDLPPYLRAVYETPLLSPARERALFLEFNFHKCQFVAMRRRLDPQEARHRDLQQLETHFCRATETKNAIVRANLRLVVSIARKHLRPALSLMDMVSDGNLTLMQAVESFDVHKGHRFSTYATLALMKGFARSVGWMALGQSAACLAAGRRLTSDVRILAECADARPQEVEDRWLAREEVGQLLGQLDPRERSIVQAHFGLDGQPSATYAQVGMRLGISKQRVRQIELEAIAKLRQAAD